MIKGSAMRSPLSFISGLANVDSRNLVFVSMTNDEFDHFLAIAREDQIGFIHYSVQALGLERTYCGGHGVSSPSAIAACNGQYGFRNSSLAKKITSA